MYCFAKLCRICLNTPDSRLIKLNNLDYDKIRIREKLKFCIPEVSNASHLPDLICISCCKNLRRSYSFKQMCLDNTEKLSEYALQLAVVCKQQQQGNLSVGLVDLYNKNQVAVKQPDDLPIIKHLADNQSVSMHTISLNQWDLFETKFTCRCIKEYSSFTEETRHLCKSCEEDLVDFQLSKVKVGVENRYNSSQSSSDFVHQSEISYEYSVSESPNSRKEIRLDYENNDTEHGYDYSNVLMCEMSVRNTQNEVNMMRSVSYTQYNDSTAHTSEVSDNDNSADDIFGKVRKFKCPLCIKNYTRHHDLLRHYKVHNQPYKPCSQCRKKYARQDDLDAHINRTHTKSTRKSIVHQKITRIFVHNKERNDFEPKFINFNPKLNNFIPKHTEFVPKLTNFVPKLTDFDPKVNNFDPSANNVDHSNDFEKNTDLISCTICENSFENKTLLAIHQMTHEKEFKCKKCNKEFLHKDILSEHMLTHSLPRIYQCSYCSKSFNYSSNLKRHVRSHAISNKRDLNNRKSTHDEYIENNSNSLKKRKIHENSDQMNIEINSPKISKPESPKKSKLRLSDDQQLHNHDINKEKQLKIKKEKPDMQLDSSAKKSKLHQNDHIEEKKNNHEMINEKHNIKHVDSKKSKMRKIRDQNNKDHDVVVHYTKASPNKSSKEAQDLKINPKLSTSPNNLSKRDINNDSLQSSDVFNHIANTNQTGDYTCPELNCTQSFSILKKYYRHLHDHNSLRSEVDKMLYKCVECYKCYSNISSIYKHMEIHPSGKKKMNRIEPEMSRFVCKDCGKGYNYIKHFNRHIANHEVQDDEIEVKEEVESDNESMENDYDEINPHDYLEIDTNRYTCYQCDKSYTTATNLKRHFLSHSTEKYSCSICVRKFVHLDILEKHILSHSLPPKPLETWFCKICNRPFHYKANLKRHMQTHGILANNCLMTCKICDDYFDRKATLLEHVITVHTRGQLCRHCKRKFGEDIDIGEHMLNKHTNIADKECTDCDIVFDDVTSFRQHIQTHEQQVEPAVHTCDLCDKRYKSKYSLNRHYFTHTT